MFKKLTVKGTSPQQRELAERTAHAGCFPECNYDCKFNSISTDFVDNFSVLLLDGVTMVMC